MIRRGGRHDPCPVCKKPVRLDTYPRAEGVSGDVRVAVLGLPYLGCGDPAHPKRWATANFGAEFIDTLHKQIRHPRRLLGLRCSGCRNKLDPGTMSAPRDLLVRIGIAGVRPFSIETQLRMLVCSRCGLEQLGPETDRKLSDALLDAFARVQLKRN